MRNNPHNAAWRLYRPPDNRMTPHEQAVYDLRMQGYGFKFIAHKLNIKVKNAQNIYSRCKQKFEDAETWKALSE